MKSPVLAFRIVGVLLLLFAAGHTYGFLTLRPPTPQAAAVRVAMDAVHFTVSGRDYSFGGFYVGFGLFVTLSFLLLAWQGFLLGELAKRQSSLVPAIGWPMVLFFVASTVVSAAWFGPPPIVLSAVVTLCLAWGTWRSRPA
jgi:hypothetical protein